MEFLMDFDHKYLTQEQLDGFSNYKYSAVDTNPISLYLMHPFWNYTVQLFPKWIAPNVLTFAGFLMTVLAMVILAGYDYHFYAGTGYPGTSPVPGSVFMAVAILIFVAYTLDGIDGKQARRTGMSGPLGELFDHGLDSWTAVLIPVCLYSVFGRADFGIPPVRSEFSVTPFRYYGIVWNVFLTFYTTHWEKYITGVLFLPWGYDFSMLATTAMFAVTYYIGHEGWKMTLFGTLASGRILEIVFYLTSLFATLPVSIYNVSRAFREGKGKNLSLNAVFRPLYALAGLLVTTLLWASLSHNDIVTVHPRAYYLMTGTIFSNITCRLVVSQMSGSKCPIWNYLINIAMLAMLLSLILPQIEGLLLYALWTYSTLAHIHYGTCVVRQMCRHFRLRPFTIGKFEN